MCLPARFAGWSDNERKVGTQAVSRDPSLAGGQSPAALVTAAHASKSAMRAMSAARIWLAPVAPSASRSGDREIALGYIKRGFNSVGTRLEAVSGDGGPVSVEVVALPFSR